GVISGGAVLRGAGGYLGHMMVRPDGRKWHCGCRGCWETEVCEAALRRALGLPADTGRGKLIAELRELAADPPVALARLAEFDGWLTIGLVNVVNMLAPELVVLGNLLTALPKPVLDAVAAQVHKQSIVSQAVGDTRVVRSALGDDAQLIGTAELAFGPVLDAAASAATA
ncbi:MAG: ROK family protein, partial [Gammaproteobacteria bacterium]